MRNVNIKEQVTYPETEAAVKTFSYRRPITIMILSSATLLALMAFFFYFDIITTQGSQLVGSIGPEFLLFVLGGFIAQMIDGSLGMAYGVSASTFLMSFGVPPAATSAS